MTETATTAPATRYELRRRAAWIRLNRPEKMNAIDPDTIEGITAGLDRSLRDSARTVVLTGSGNVFCAGADLKFAMRGLGDFSAIDGVLGDANALIRRIAAHPMPVVAAVNGTAIAGGLELILACDLALAAEDAVLADGHANFGVFPGGGSAVRLPHIIGSARAKHLLFTGRTASASEWRDLGVINDVVPGDQLEGAVQTLCDALAKRSLQMQAGVKRIVNDSLNLPLEEALDLELDACRTHLRSTDAAEGLAAFSDGRRPNFD
ncbi:MAG: enoyl-CoA hydratase/isomerase family protein [Solirubrobacteraceae bacterium]